MSLRLASNVRPRQQRSPAISRRASCSIPSVRKRAAHKPCKHPSGARVYACSPLLLSQWFFTGSPPSQRVVPAVAGDAAAGGSIPAASGRAQRPLRVSIHETVERGQTPVSAGRFSPGLVKVGRDTPIIALIRRRTTEKCPNLRVSRQPERGGVGMVFRPPADPPCPHDHRRMLQTQRFHRCPPRIRRCRRSHPAARHRPRHRGRLW